MVVAAKKYEKLYDEKDRALLEKLNGVKRKEDPKKEEEITEEDAESVTADPEEGYEINANPTVSKQHLEDDKNAEQRTDPMEEEDDFEHQRRRALVHSLSEEMDLLTGKPMQNDVCCFLMCSLWSAPRL